MKILKFLKAVYPYLPLVKRWLLPKLQSWFTAGVAKNCHVQEILENVLVSTGADRTQVHQYHNGGFNLAGVGFQKISMTNELNQVAIGEKIQWSQNLPIGQIACEISDMKDGVVVRNLATEKSISAMISDNKDRPIGLLRVLWESPRRLDIAHPEVHVDRVKTIAEALGVILSQGE